MDVVLLLIGLKKRIEMSTEERLTEVLYEVVNILMENNK